MRPWTGRISNAKRRRGTYRGGSFDKPFGTFWIVNEMRFSGGIE